MDAEVTVISSPTVTVRLTSTLTEFEVERRFNRDISIAEFKEKLEMIVGIPPSHMDLELFSTSDKFLQKLDENEALLGSYPVDSDCRIHVIDRSGAQPGKFTDVSQVEKFEISDDAYDKKPDNVRSLHKKYLLDVFNGEEMVKKGECCSGT